MSTEQARVGLYNRLDEVLGKPYSDTLMSGLAVDARQLATKADIAILGDRLERQIEKLDDRMHSFFKTLIWSMVALTGIYAGLVTLIVRL